jgi:RimJ/RimL family protein N-acetyltransferase
MFARTERLLLRPGWIEDAPALHAAIADEAIVRNLATAPWPYRREDAEAFLTRERRPSDLSLLILRRTESAPEFVGTIGLGPRPDGKTELGYWISRRHWNRGYATEAARAVIGIARHSLRLKRLHAGHFLDNPASGRVLEKIGFRPTRLIAPRFSAGRGETAPCRLYEIALSEADCPAAQAARAMAA